MQFGSFKNPFLKLFNSNPELENLKNEWVTKRRQWLKSVKDFEDKVNKRELGDAETRKKEELAFQKLTTETVELEDTLKQQNVNMDKLEKMAQMN